MQPIRFTFVGAALLACLATGRAAAQAREGTSTPVTPVPDSATTRRQAGFTGFDISVTATVNAVHQITSSYPVVNKVYPGSPAAHAGVTVGDVILEVNGVDARERGALFPVPGVQQVLRVRRGEGERELLLIPVVRRPAQ